MTSPRTAVLLLAGLLLPAAPALAGGTIDATQYMPLGAFNAWEMIDKATWNDGAGTVDAFGNTIFKAGHQIISVTKTDVVNGVTRYNVRTKLFQDVPDVLFQFGVEGDTLFLYGVRILVPVDLSTDDDFDISIPPIFFDEPVVVGSTTTPLNTDLVSQVTAKFTVKISVGPLDASGNVFIEAGSTVTARWELEPAINTPLGTIGEGVPAPLARLILDFDFTYFSDDGDINDEIEDLETHKSVSGVMGPGIGFVEIDGQGSQKKIVNKAVLAGELLYNPADPDSFPPLPVGDVNTIEVPLSTGVVILTFVGGMEGGITDGTLTLEDVALQHTLGGALILTGSLSAGGFGPVDVVMLGKAKYNALTGGVVVALKGKTKKLPEFAKIIKLSAKQEIPTIGEGGGPTLDILYNAGTDPLSGEPITGTLPVPVEPFSAQVAFVDVNLPVDVPKIKNNTFVVNPAKRALGAEGTLTLQQVLEGGAEGASLTYPVILLQSAKVAEGLPTVRSYTLLQTGTKSKLFKFGATSTGGGPEDYDLTKLSGKLAGIKQKPLLENVTVTVQGGK